MYIHGVKCEMTQRKEDGRWVLWAFVPDPNENIQDEVWKDRDQFYPWRWVPVRTYDYFCDMPQVVRL